MIMSDRAREMHWEVSVAQASRSPTDKKSSKGMRGYVRKLHKAATSVAPWEEKSKLERLKALKTPRAKTGDEALQASEEFAKKLGL
jgi:hypothetical protein